jgi:hypothetical protein
MKKDLHKETASKYYNISYNSVTEDQRKVGKVINFLICYGGNIAQKEPPENKSLGDLNYDDINLKLLSFYNKKHS